MANVKTGDPAVDTFLKGYAPPVREIAVRTREAILAVLPGATEKVYPGWKVIQYGAGAAYCRGPRVYQAPFLTACRAPRISSRIAGAPAASGDVNLT